MNITVYLGSTYGNDPDFKTKIIELGTWIAKNNHTLVFGGSKTGLMGRTCQQRLECRWQSDWCRSSNVCG